MDLKKIGIVLSIIVAVISISTAAIKLDRRWAKQAYVSIVEGKVSEIEKDVDSVGLRLEHKILRDDIRNYQQRIWDIEDRYKNKEMPPDIKNEYRNLQMEKEEMQQEDDMIRKKLNSQ